MTRRRTTPASVPAPTGARSTICSIEACEKPVKSRGWCAMHYRRWRVNGDPEVAKRRWDSYVRHSCGAVDCDADADGGRGYCSRHYQRLRRHGDANYEAPEKHGLYRYELGCRCAECREAVRIKSRERREEAKTRLESFRHGSPATYALGCRCEDCGTAWAAYRREQLRSDPDARGKANSRSRMYRQRSYNASLPNATKHGQRWTGPELELVATRNDLSVADLAKMLNRTTAAVETAKYRVKHEPKYRGVVEGRAGRRDARPDA